MSGLFALDRKNHLAQLRSRGASLLVVISHGPRPSPPTFVGCSCKMVALSQMQRACGCSAQQPKVRKCVLEANFKNTDIPIRDECMASHPSRTMKGGL